MPDEMLGVRMKIFLLVLIAIACSWFFINALGDDDE
jgi:hypothetical protein